MLLTRSKRKGKCNGESGQSCMSEKLLAGSLVHAVHDIPARTLWRSYGIGACRIQISQNFHSHCEVVVTSYTHLLARDNEELVGCSCEQT